MAPGCPCQAYDHPGVGLVSRSLSTADCRSRAPSRSGAAGIASLFGLKVTTAVSRRGGGYMRGDLELIHPPSFIKEIMPVLERAMVEQFHAMHIETTLIAEVPPQVRLRKNMSHFHLLEELSKANSDVWHGTEMLACLRQDLKKLHFDGNHTLKFVFHTKRLATH
ncbi:hypothetical protein PI124_g6990 [Phytophthora idaei]|nr:hypothetical protein PI125_g6651 [Phytophthora idaei]KAG3161551.1 hypothetical protein PI126_g6388 [Phytophthora idaei]KAG3248322.1 hypothetical protein PI124_g6990 [Phytophthora idaei]